MMPKITITTENIKELANVFVDTPAWMPRFVNVNMEGLGRRIAYLMGMQVKKHRYTGTLEDSIKSKYDSQRMRLEIGPTAKRGGRWDAGLLLQRGTRPIPNLPYGPIAAWAAFRGLPAGPIWMSIKERGVKAHPFIEETLARGDVGTAIRNTAKRIGIDLTAHALQAIPAKDRSMRMVRRGETVFPMT